ncbi:MAG: 3-methyladenine DNA glycosylase [Rhodospirillaceae bacterium]|nr:MAG: 3-methyladenine DNA glycosylase [Rhodospirillaceae bacterium]
MRSFEEIYEISAERKGGVDKLEALLAESSIRPEQADDRWLSRMAEYIFKAGFTWKVVDHMWPGFEKVFEGFDVGFCSMLHEDDFARLVSDKRIVRHGTKIRSVQQNAVFITDLAHEFGSADQAFRDWPSSDYVGLLLLLKKRGSRLGGNTGQYLLRSMGVDSFILARDVVARLVAEDIIDKNPTSQKSMKQVQQAFNGWQEESGKSLTYISRVLGMSVG